MFCHSEHIRFAQCKLREGLARGGPRCFATLSMTGPALVVKLHNVNVVPTLLGINASGITWAMR